MAADRNPSPGGWALYDARWLVASAVLVTLYVGLTVLPGNPLTAGVGLFVLFVGPGYGLGAILFGPPARRLSLAANLAMIVGLSVLFNGIVGIVLLAGGFGLSATALGLAALGPVDAGAVLQLLRRVRGTRGATRASVARVLQLPGFTPRQRRTVWGLLVATLVVFGAIAYEASVVPTRSAGLTIAVTGPDGSTDTLPTSGVANESLAVLLTLESPHDLPTAVLGIESALLGQNATFVAVPWSQPLTLGHGVASSDALALSSRTAVTVPVTFSFPQPGTYTVTFSLTDPSDASRTTAELTEVIA